MKKMKFFGPQCTYKEICKNVAKSKSSSANEACGE